MFAVASLTRSHRPRLLSEGRDDYSFPSSPFVNMVARMAPLEQTERERPLLAALDALLDGALRGALARAVDAARRHLERSREPFGWAAIETGIPLPLPIRSAWVFVIDSRARPEGHRHPNSAQHLRSLEGRGRVALTRGEEHSEHVLDERRPWLVIAEDVVHEVRSADEREWVVASFHTVSADELLEVTSGGERRYSD